MQAGSAESVQISWESLLHQAASTMKAPTIVAHTVRSGIRTMYIRVLMDKNNPKLQYRRAMGQSIGEEGCGIRGRRVWSIAEEGCGKCMTDQQQKQ